jgi:flagellar protein FlbT
VPLLLEIKSGDKLMINGAVIECAGAGTRLLVHNQAAILREKEVMTDDQAVTPASRTYFALQCAYVFPEQRDRYLTMFNQFIRDYVAAAPSAAPIADKMLEAVTKGNLYQGLKHAFKLLAHEGEVLRHFEADLKHETEDKGE